VRAVPRSWRLIVPAAALAGLAAGCSVPGFGAPDPASEQGKSIFELWQGFFIAALFVGALVWGLLIFVLLRYRHRSGSDGAGADEVPSQNAYNIPLEIFYTAAPVVAVAVLFGFSVATEHKVNALHDNPAVRVEVVGYQWSWEFRYTDEHLVISGEPGQPPELVLPVDERSRLRLVSTDVAHSFWVPDFLSKRDLIPGVHNEIEVTPTRLGTYDGRCAEFCGIDHWRMSFTVRVVPRREYDAWLSARKAKATASTTSTSTTTTSTTEATPA
jgi:cytochrome c oxidase subunit 2